MESKLKNQNQSKYSLMLQPKLKNLCVLSFMMSCFLIVLLSLTLMDEESGTSNYLLLLLEIGSLVGVLLMWRLERVGFYIYTVSEILPWLVFLLVEDRSKIFNGTIALPNFISDGFYFITIGMLLIDAIFIIYYFKAIKEIKKAN